MLLRLLGCLLLVLLALDAFRTVLLPSARGFLDRAWVTLLWRVARGLPWQWARQSAGPLSIALTIGSWLVLLWLGFACPYLPLVDGLGYSSDVRLGGSSGVAALYFSGTVLTTWASATSRRRATESACSSSCRPRAGWPSSPPATCVPASRRWRTWT